MSAVKNFLKGNIYLITVGRILIIFVFYTLCRLLFFIYNFSHFEKLNFNELITIFTAGILFDASAIVYTNIIYLFLFLLPFKFRYNRHFKVSLMILFFITNGIGIMANLADTAYYEYALQRTGMNVFEQFQNEENIGILIGSFITGYWYFTLLWMFFMAVIIYLYLRFRIQGPKIKSVLRYYSSGILIFGIGAILIIGGARGGFKHFTQPITMSNAWSYVKNPDDAALVLNTPFTMIHTLGKNGFERVRYFSDEKDLEKIFSPVHKAIERPGRNKNVVILIIESLNKEFVGSLNKDLDNGSYKGYTPFLDSLIKVSKVFTHSYANGRKSIDILPSLFCSLPQIGEPFVMMTPYYKNHLNSLPGMMKEMGYKSAFFHGAPNGSFGLESFTNIIGVDEYFGMNEYNNKNDYDGTWGIWDEEFLLYFAQTIDTFSTPFLATLFTLSSHHPFKLPDQYKDRFRDGDYPLLHCIQYTDYSLMRFFKKASGMDWFKNTLFVITADHVSISQRPEFQNEIGYFSVPVIFYQPEEGLTGIDTITNAQQIDIMPTVLNYLGYNKDYIAFGKDLFDKQGENYAFNYLNDTYRLFFDDYLFIYNEKETNALYHLESYRSLSNISENHSKQDSMELFTKAFIQQYKNRMIDNRLHIQRKK